jgi:predicted nucleic-acid-binding protein
VIAVDTNVLARYIVRDDPAESRIATRVIEGMCSADEPGFIGLVVLCELVWVLDRGYGYQRKQVGDVLRQILAVAELEVEDSDLTWAALRLFEAGRADFADYIIGLVARQHGRRTTVTFDRRAIDGDLFSSAPKTS